ncbi:MAG: hypothetical protein C6W57_08035 [Caldibacillus debilis]|nr:MAG: hypothetical protein C6W57_08035 [Caldibacillus debilis]
MRSKRKRKNMGRGRAIFLFLAIILLSFILWISISPSFTRSGEKTVRSVPSMQETAVRPDRQPAGGSGDPAKGGASGRSGNGQKDQKTGKRGSRVGNEEQPGKKTQGLETKTAEGTSNPPAEKGGKENSPKEQAENAGPKENGKGDAAPENPPQKTVFLTFDDGPNASTKEILRLLEKYDMKATFFMVEPNMKKYPEIVKEVIRQGHRIGLHSVTHSKTQFYASKKSVVAEMKKTQTTLEKVSGKRSRIIRTPYGSKPYMKPEYMEAVKREGFILWDWNVDSRDWKLTDGSFVENTIHQIEQFHRPEPIVILLHDRKTTAEHLEKLFIYLKERHFQTDTINEQLEPVQL